MRDRSMTSGNVPGETATLPSGTVTFLFTDVEGSTRAWDEDPQRTRRELARQQDLLGRVVAQRGGVVFKTTGDGLLAAFSDPGDALGAALSAQLELRDAPLRVRMALHTGVAEPQEGDYQAPALNRCSRLLAAAWGGQVILSLATEELVRDLLPEGVSLLDLGTARLPDLSLAERVFQLLHPGLPADFPPLRTPGQAPHNLPVQLTSFVGRERELKEIDRLLGETRLLTLVGVGGSGKSRLALEAASRRVDRHPDGVWLVELAPIGEADRVPAAVAGALGVKEQPGRLLVDVLEGALWERRILVVLDNCEHLIESAAALTDRLLRACPSLSVLATSREGLGIGGEMLFQVPPLDPSSEGVRLFLDRAGAVRADVGLDDQMEVVAQICRRLDGLPLAIELAAARVRTLPVDEIAARLDDRFRLLTGGSRTATPRQQTLEAAVGWSHDLLSEPERRLFDRLSVFSGGFTLDAAEQVCSRDPIRDREVLDLLSSLVDKSLVLALDRRYRTMETIRQYGREKLVALGEADDTRRRHADFYLGLAEKAVPGLRGSASERSGWLDRLSADYENLLAALDWTAESGEVERFQRLVAAMSSFWSATDRCSEGREWLEKALAEEWSDASLRARAALGLVESLRMENYRRARQLAEEALRVFESSGETWWTANALASLADVSWYEDDLGASEAYARRSLQLFRELDYPRGIVNVLVTLGRMLRDRGDLEQAIDCLREVERFRGEIAPTRMINPRVHLGVTLWYAGDHDQALQTLAEALRAAREADHRWEIAHVGLRLGQVKSSRGEHDPARSHLEESLPLLRELGDAHCAALAATALGLAMSRTGRRGGRALLREGLLANRRLGARGAIAGSLTAVGTAAAEVGDHRSAVALLAASEALRAELEAPLPPPEKRDQEYLVASLRAELGPEDFQASWSEGASIGLDAAVELALEIVSQPGDGAVSEPVPGRSARPGSAPGAPPRAGGGGGAPTRG